MEANDFMDDGDVVLPPEKVRLGDFFVECVTGPSNYFVKTKSASANTVPSLRLIADDEEKMAAVFEDGRVLIAAGAGSGKTTLLTSRIGYLVQERRVNPSRVFITAFNRKATSEIGDRLRVLLGDEAYSAMSASTMHSAFRRIVTEHGSPEQRERLTKYLVASTARERSSTDTRRKGKSKEKGADAAQIGLFDVLDVPDQASCGEKYVAPTQGEFKKILREFWRICEGKLVPASAMLAISSWRMNDVTPEQALTDSLSEDEYERAKFYAYFLGVKGETPGWQPPNLGVLLRQAAEDRSQGKAKIAPIEKTLEAWREMKPSNVILGDFDDMIILARDVLKTNPQAREAVQQQYDHICVDEAQDLNVVQHQIVDFMSEHIQRDSKGKSFWVVGDEVQSVNRFAGADPKLFTARYKDPNMKSFFISTNYRCAPEIVAVANRLLERHPRDIPMVSRADATKAIGEASIELHEPQLATHGATLVVREIQAGVSSGERLEDYAVLTRTNLEMNAFELLCIFNQVPYMRRAGSSFLEAFEVNAVLTYVHLATSSDLSKLQQHFVSALLVPEKFYSPEVAIRNAYESTMREVAEAADTSPAQLNPFQVFHNMSNRKAFVKHLRPNALPWQIEADIKVFQGMFYAIVRMRNGVNDETPTIESTTALLDQIMEVPGKVSRETKLPIKLREVLTPPNPEGTPEDEDPDKEALGHVSFLYQLAASITDPFQFVAKYEEFKDKGQDLRVNATQWNTEQERLQPDPAKRAAPPAVTLSTVHSVKGAQWKNVYVLMQGGTFPRTPSRKEREEVEMLPPEKAAKVRENWEKDFLTDRQLAYVAITRAKENLTVISPQYKQTTGQRVLLKPSPFISEAGLKSGQNVPQRQGSR